MTIIKQGEATLKNGQADDPLGQYSAELISDTGGLTQFGALVEELPPGSASSFDHWHAHEDEMIYVLEGTPTVREDGKETRLAAGDAVCWPAGSQIAHCLFNETDRPVRYLVIGTRAPRDVVTYPLHNRQLTLDRQTAERVYTTLDGRPASKPLP